MNITQKMWGVERIVAEISSLVIEEAIEIPNFTLPHWPTNIGVRKINLGVCKYFLLHKSQTSGLITSERKRTSLFFGVDKDGAISFSVKSSGLFQNKSYDGDCGQYYSKSDGFQNTQVLLLLNQLLEMPDTFSGTFCGTLTFENPWGIYYYFLKQLKSDMSLCDCDVDNVRDVFYKISSEWIQAIKTNKATQNLEIENKEGKLVYEVVQSTQEFFDEVRGLCISEIKIPKFYIPQRKLCFGKIAVSLGRKEYYYLETLKTGGDKIVVFTKKHHTIRISIDTDGALEVEFYGRGSPKKCYSHRGEVAERMRVFIIFCQFREEISTKLLAQLKQNIEEHNGLTRAIKTGFAPFAPRSFKPYSSVIH